jgi:hypothetical protein
LLREQRVVGASVGDALDAGLAQEGRDEGPAEARGRADGREAVLEGDVPMTALFREIDVEDGRPGRCQFLGEARRYLISADEDGRPQVFPRLTGRWVIPDWAG